MTLRFTESEKWLDPWFRALQPECKLAWLYILDVCDIAGLVKNLDGQLANFQIGYEVDWELFLEESGERVHRLRSGKIWIVRFIEFQQKTKTLNQANNCHRGIIQRLAGSGITPIEFGYSIEETRGSLGAKQPLARGYGKGKGKGKGKVSSGPKDDWVFPDGWDSPELRKALDDWQSVRKQKTPKVSTSKIFKNFDSPEHLKAAAEECESSGYQGIKTVYGQSAATSSDSAYKPRARREGL